MCNAEYVLMFRKDIIVRKINIYFMHYKIYSGITILKLEREADCNEVVLWNTITRNSALTIGLVY